MKKYLIILISLMSYSTAYSASFDCQKAQSINEKAICSNSNLSKLDEDLLKAYKASVSSSTDSEVVKASQRSWLKEIKVCESNQNTVATCLTDAYTKRIATLSNNGSSISVAANAISQLTKQLPVNQEIQRTPTEPKESANVNDATKVIEQTQAVQGNSASQDYSEPSQVAPENPAPQASEPTQVVPENSAPQESNVSAEQESSPYNFFQVTLALITTLLLIALPWLFRPTKAGDENSVASDVSKTSHVSGDKFLTEDNTDKKENTTSSVNKPKNRF